MVNNIMNLEITILCFFYTILVVYFSFDLANELIKKKKLTMIFLCKAMFFLIEGIVPLIIHYTYLFEGSLESLGFTIDYSKNGITALYINLLFALIGYYLINLAYKIRLKKHTYQNEFSYKNYIALEATTFVCFFVSLISFYLWTLAFGGIYNFILEANSIRSGVSSTNNSLAFFKHPTSIMLICSYSFLLLFLNNKKFKKTNIIFFIISSIFSVLYCLATDGRMTTGFYFLTFIVIYFKNIEIKRGNISLKRFIYLIIALVCVCVFMLKMDDITNLIRGNEVNTEGKNSFINSFIFELSFVTRSFQISFMNLQKVGFQFYNDFLSGLLAWVPTSLKPSNLIRLWEINTNLAGVSSGEYPCGIISQGYYDGGVIGIVVIFLIYGFALKYVDSFSNKNLFKVVVFVSMFSIFTRAIPYGMLYDFVLGSFGIVIFIVIYKFLNFILKDFCFSQKY